MSNPIGLFALLLLSGCTGMQVGGANAFQLNGMAYTYFGKGDRTVVFQAGLGDSGTIWNEVLPTLALSDRVFTYDRPGYGSSEWKNSARDPCTIAEEEHKLLLGAGIHPPYVLVGHSLGGLYQFVFAKLYPEEVSGIVLVDATLPHHWQQMQDEAPSAAAMMRTMRSTLLTPVEKREFDDSNLCLDRLNLTEALKMPARVLVRTEFKLEELGSFKAMTLKHQSDWLKLTGVNHIQKIIHSGHYIQKDQPQAVIEAVKSIGNSE